jgi:hypothetical protein
MVSMAIINHSTLTINPLACLAGDDEILKGGKPIIALSKLTTDYFVQGLKVIYLYLCLSHQAAAKS